MKSLPAWVERLLRIICPEELYDQIEGDLIEIYNHEVKTMGIRKAKQRLTIACLRFMRPGICCGISSELNSRIVENNVNEFHFQPLRSCSFIKNYQGQTGGFGLACFTEAMVSIEQKSLILVAQWILEVRRKKS